eukprot:1160769-Pelagomonas_calceolata.AAC.8
MSWQIRWSEKEAVVRYRISAITLRNFSTGGAKKVGMVKMRKKHEKEQSGIRRFPMLVMYLTACLHAKIAVGSIGLDLSTLWGFNSFALFASSKSRGINRPHVLLIKWLRGQQASICPHAET